MKRKEGAFVVAQAAIFVGVIALVSLPVYSSTPGESVSTAASTVGSNGLRLSISANATLIRVGQYLHVNISVINTLPKTNSVPPSNDWAFQGIPVALWPPCLLNSSGLPPLNYSTPAQVVLLKGEYNLANLSSVADVHFSYQCAEAGIVSHAVFQPSSDEVNLTGVGFSFYTNRSAGPFQMWANFTTSGYWNLTTNARRINTPIIGEPDTCVEGCLGPWGPTSTAFVPGGYTIAVADEWGQAVLLHFSVMA